jgi:RNA polymerase sigma-70 factor (ECF subfamily)
MALAGRATTVKLALIDGTPGAVWAPGGRPRAVFAFRVIGNAIAEIEIVTEPAVVAAVQVQVL